SCLYIYNNYASGIRELRRLPLNKIISEVSNEFNNKIGLSKDIYFGINEDWWSVGSYLTGYSFSDKYTNCYEENSTCDIALLTDDFRIEARNIAINKKEGKSPLANSLFPGDTIEFNSIYMPLNPNDFSLVEEAMRAYIQTMSKGRADMYDITKDTVTISFDEVEHHEYNIKYAKTDSKILSKIENINDKLLSSLKRSKYSIVADDLEFINAFYYNTIGFGNFDTISFNNTLTKIINNKHVNYYYVLHGGAGNKYINFTGGNLVLYYDGIAYKLFDEHLYQNLNHVIYIPNDTKETTADYVKAAQKRIDDYLGENSGVIISYNGNYDAMDMKNFGSTLAELNIDEDKFDGKEYLIKFGHRSETVLIYKDSNRMKKSTFMANDIKNNINIKSETANYPTNTIVNSNIFDKNDDKHHEHLEKLNFEDGYVVDLSLFSNKLGDINEFDGGNFEVNLPLNDFKYYGLDLYAFYVDDEGNVEKYKVNVDENGFATFETTHFSTYIIADIEGKVGEEPPVQELNLTTTAYYNKIRLIYNEIKGATKYVVYRCDSDGSDCVKLATTTSTTYNHSSLGLGKTYYYKVVAYDGSTKLMTSSLVKGKTALSRPVITSVSNNRYQNTIIKWNAVSGATKYYLYRCDSDGSDCKFVDDTTSTSYTTTGGSEGVTYMYKVKAYRSGIYSSTSTGVTGMKLKDSISFSLTKPSYRKINISISHLSTATKYYIYRATSKSGSYSLIATIDATGETLNYLDTVSFNKTYYYKVKASNGVNTTATTSYKYITSNTMDKPVITSVSNNRYQNTIISWNKVNGATSYNVYRCSSTGSDCEKIANTKSTSYTTTGGSEGVTYMYKVKPYVGSTAGITSTGVTGMKLKDSISFSVTKPSYRKINISISHLSTAKKYYIYRATSNSGSYSLIATLEATGETLNYLDTVSFNKTYYYKIKANNGVNSTAATGYKYITSNTMDKPVITSVSNNRYQNTIIKWNKVNGATSYNVYRCSDTGSNCEKITNTKSTSYTTTGGSEGVTYMYKVRPYVGSTAGITSNGVTGMKLKDGISFSVKSNSYRAIDITISHLSTAKKYYIYRATSKSGSYSLIATVAATGENIVYTDKSLSFNKTYYYKVKANNGVNTSAATSYKYDKVDGIGKPNVEVSVEDKKVTLNMPKVYGSTGVEIYYSTDGKTYKLLKRTTSTSYTRDLAVGKHYFKVRAYKLYSSKYYYSSYTTLETIEIVDTPEVTPSV
ncbi:MAG: hypothetical protein IJ966_01190, partial [Bacilli bacterium]|nr:hypothetical protein [Bacilli bacterium]